MRGKRHHRQLGRRGDRIIPAHAGQTSWHRSCSTATPDHPRACGANQLTMLVSSRRTGSSPRMRGKLTVDYCIDFVLRIIPAHAGQTRISVMPLFTCKDHPRACGANPLYQERRCVGFGSSPRMRGKQVSAGNTAILNRIIPAHAGQTSTEVKTSCFYADHPRACGANVYELPVTVVRYGSSPRMRGKLRNNAILMARNRIIPAHAGQTPSTI